MQLVARADELHLGWLTPELLDVGDLALLPRRFGAHRGVGERGHEACNALTELRSQLGLGRTLDVLEVVVEHGGDDLVLVAPILGDPGRDLEQM